MEVITLEIDEDGCGRRSLNSRLMPPPRRSPTSKVCCNDSKRLIELQDPGTGEVVFRCRPWFTGVLLLKTATRSAVTLRH